MDENKSTTDVILIGAGIMSGTLGVMLKELEPGLSINVFERLDVAAAEISDAWNNAGTGHSAFCELNYTPAKEDGSIDISKAIKIAASFEESRQFWSYLIRHKLVDLPESFIRQVPHISFVWGRENVAFLRKRYEAMQQSPLFEGMQYSEDIATLREWIPLMMQQRTNLEDLAATKMDIGTDVNFGSLTRCMFQRLKQCSDDVHLHFHHDVRSIKQERNGLWRVRVKDRTTGKRSTARAKFVFIGAGGGALPLLLKSGIKEGKGYGGFPVSGQWLRCTNEEVIEQHNAKVYGLAEVGAPPMSVPHLDTRMIKGKKELLFGPFAGFTTRFLKEGSLLDLFKSLRPSNIWAMLSAGFRNIPLTKYLVQQVKLSHDERVATLSAFVPNAKASEWELEIAGQRVQVIKRDDDKGGVLQFGTEIVSGQDGSLAALLGASPGASTAVSIMLNLLQQCFPQQFASPQWQQKLKEMLPSFGRSLADDPALLKEVRKYTSETLQLEK